MSKHRFNGFNTTDLVLSVMSRVAYSIGVDIDDDNVSTELYWICCDLESFPEDEGFGSSDSYGYVQEAKRVFHIVAAA